MAATDGSDKVVATARSGHDRPQERDCHSWTWRRLGEVFKESGGYADHAEMVEASRSQRRLRRAVMMVAPVVPVVVLGVILAAHTRSWTTERATANAADAAGLVADFAISPLLEEEDFTAATINQQRVEELDATLRPFIGDQIVRIKIWDATGRVVYSDDSASIGVTYPMSHELEDALLGETSSEVSELDKAENSAEQEFDRLLEVYVPVRAGQGSEYDGAFELYLPYDPIAESIEADTRRIYLMLTATLVLLYLALARVAVMWSRSHRRAEDKDYEANHDPLTGLPNRRKFQATLEAIVDSDDDRPVAVMFLDLDDFKTVNDQHGHAVGDALLKAVAGRLRNALRDDVTLARLGGDEFAVLVPHLNDPTNATEIADRLITALDAPIRLGELRLDVHASIGIDVTPATRVDPEATQRNADAAMYMAKGAGKAQHATFDPVLHGHLHESQEQARRAKPDLPSAIA